MNKGDGDFDSFRESEILRCAQACSEVEAKETVARSAKIAYGIANIGQGDIFVIL